MPRLGLNLRPQPRTLLAVLASHLVGQLIMQYRTLGRTGIKVSTISFGGGPVSGLMTGTDTDAQHDVVAAAINTGINWFDTAPGYGAGSSEANLGRALSEIKPVEPIHIATKVRIPLDSTEPITDIIRRSVDESLQRLRASSITLLQLHNGITAERGDEPASITPPTSSRAAEWPTHSIACARRDSSGTRA